MSYLTSKLSTLARCTNHNILTSLHMLRATVVNSECRRSICSSPIRLQQEAAEEQPATPEQTTSRDFSIYPPMPGEDSPLRWGGMKFEELPIVNIKATYNNTLIHVSDHSGQYIARTSCGCEGFRNIKKSTPIAAQTTGISAASSAIKGLSMGGLEVVSITDNTPVPHNGCRPRKARRM
ncbi:28S ribosomal protein S11, mitochondrial isoform X2 [Engraulis encrasicolus]|uniref:28S ribosomal protein S11, mitochondrial isoform X2 n=1 Tax=Engraulis encrasicolus TaxID=184585 RepID=UPI002FD5245D